jgi:hypothetical protein
LRSLRTHGAIKTHSSRKTGTNYAGGVEVKPFFRGIFYF